ncbi:MAG: CHASE sensor domain-containing protein, partial [Nitrospirota bacterium]
MRLFKDISIKTKLIRISLFTAGFALILSAMAITINEVIVFKKSTLNELTIQTEIIGSNSAAALMFNDAKAAAEILSALRANGSVDLALIYTKDGALFAKYSRDGKKPAV